jgi:hypothetical protein
MPNVGRGQRCFEMLERYGYVKAVASPWRNGTIHNEIMEEGWLELERALFIML